MELESLPPMTFPALMHAGVQAVSEQRNVESKNLAREYMRWQVNPEELEKAAPRPEPVSEAQRSAAQRAADQAVASAGAAREEAARALLASNERRERERAAMPPEELERLLAAESAAAAASEAAAEGTSSGGGGGKKDASDDEDSKGYGRVLDPTRVESEKLAIDDGTLPWVWLAVPDAKALVDAKTHRLVDIRCAP